MSRRRRLAFAAAQVARAARIEAARRPALVFVTTVRVLEVAHRWACWLLPGLRDVIMVRFHETEEPEE